MPKPLQIKIANCNTSTPQIALIVDRQTLCFIHDMIALRGDSCQWEDDVMDELSDAIKIMDDLHSARKTSAKLTGSNNYPNDLTDEDDTDDFTD